MITAYRLAFTDSITSAFRPRGAAGRWNSKGVAVVYTSEHPALAALELLTSWADYEDFSRYYLYRCEFSREAVLDKAAAKGAVGDRDATRALGDSWAADKDSVALRVPSVVAPASYNYLLNPDHPGFDKSVKRETVGPFRYDPRLVSLLERARKN